MPLTIEIDSDVICPWCYIGKRRLEAALGRLDGRREVRVLWRPFELNPGMPPEGIDRRAYRTAKFGGWERSLELDARVASVGSEVGIPFAFERILRTPNTFAAHRRDLVLATKTGWVKRTGPDGKEAVGVERSPAGRAGSPPGGAPISHPHPSRYSGNGAARHRGPPRGRVA